MKPEFRGLRDSLKTLTFVAHAFPANPCRPAADGPFRIRPVGHAHRNRFTCTPRFGVIGNNPDMAAVLEAEAGSHQTTNAGCGVLRSAFAAPGLRHHPPARRGDRSAGHRALCTTRNARRGERENGARASEKCTWARLRFFFALTERRSV